MFLVKHYYYKLTCPKSVRRHVIFIYFLFLVIAIMGEFVMWTKNFERSKSSGFSLLEVLIAVLVLAVGLLGVAALQLNGLKTNQSALQRSLAPALAYSMMDSGTSQDSCRLIHAITCLLFQLG